MDIQHKEIHLHGFLADKYGEKFSLKVASIKEAIDLLDANFPGFKKDGMTCENYRVLVDEKDVEEMRVFTHIPRAARFDFVPVLHGAGKGSRAAIKFIAAAVLFVVSSGTSTGASLKLAGSGQAVAVPSTGALAAISSGAQVLASTLFLQGLSVLLTPTPKKPESDLANKYILATSGYAAGSGVPVCYGETVVGGQMISAVIESSKTNYFKVNVDGIAENVFTAPSVAPSTLTNLTNISLQSPAMG